MLKLLNPLGKGEAAQRLIYSAKYGKTRKLKMSDNAIDEKGSSLDTGVELQAHSNKHLIINVLMRQEDFEVLKKRGGPQPYQVSMALRQYLKLVAEKKWRPEMSGTANTARRFTTFQCAVSKDLWDEIRNLGGRRRAYS
jgi:hypothetical protein